MTSTSGPYQAVRWRFSVRCSDPTVGDQVARALASLRSNGAPTARCYTFVSATAERPGTLHLDAEEIATSPSDAVLYATLLWHVNRGVVAASSDHVLIHAAAAARDGSVVLLPAPMESGKTTLVAGLVRAGLRYLTDETVALRPADLGVTPYPKALSVDEGSWRVLADLRPDLPPGAEHLVGEQWQVPPDSIRVGCVATGGTPSLIVLPRYDAGAATVLRPVSRAQALVSVLEQVFDPTRDRPRDFAVLAETVRRCRTYTLVSGDLDEAVTAVLAALDDIEP